MNRRLTMAIQPLTRPEWMDNPARACAGKPVEWWFTGRGPNRAKAIRRCRACPFLKECGDWAETNGESAGIWGGRLRSYNANWRRKAATS